MKLNMFIRLAFIPILLMAPSMSAAGSGTGGIGSPVSIALVSEDMDLLIEAKEFGESVYHVALEADLLPIEVMTELEKRVISARNLDTDETVILVEE